MPGNERVVQGRWASRCGSPVSRRDDPAVSTAPEQPARSLAYITDTTAPGDYTDFIRDVGILIHECNFADDMQDWAEKTGHSSATAVAEVAKQSGAKQLYLVHADPQHPEDDPVGLDGIRKTMPQTELAEDLVEIDF